MVKTSKKDVDFVWDGLFVVGRTVYFLPYVIMGVLLNTTF